MTNHTNEMNEWMSEKRWQKLYTVQSGTVIVAYVIALSVLYNFKSVNRDVDINSLRR